jgi:hypothetical protein
MCPFAVFRGSVFDSLTKVSSSERRWDEPGSGSDILDGGAFFTKNRSFWRLVVDPQSIS